MKEFVITIDGPAGSGKSSTAKLLAERLDAAFLDTGAMYRAATLAAMKNGCNLEDTAEVGSVIDRTAFSFDVLNGQTNVQINGRDVSEEIRRPEITENVQFIASQPALREKLVKMQRDFAARHRKIITEGRDQGTVVFPDADFKFFLSADIVQRAKRRAFELQQKGISVDHKELLQRIEARDNSDMSRKTAPLAAAAEAVIIDNTNLNLEQTVEKMLEIIGSRPLYDK